MHQSLSTEDAILQSAENEFIEKGFSGARTVSIAQRAGVTHAMLHYYYRTKEQLFDKVLVSKLTQMVDCVFDSLDKSEGEVTAVQCIESFIRRHYQYLADNSSLPLFVLNEIVHKPDRIELLKTILSEKLKSVDNTFGLKYSDAVADGDISPIDLLTLITDVLMLNLSSIVMRPLFQGLTHKKDEEYDAYRLEENIILIRNRIKP